MKKIISLFLILIVGILLYCKVFTLDSRLVGQWKLDVYDRKNSLIAEIELEFTTTYAESDTEWKKLIIISFSPQQNQFYPDETVMGLEQELSYKLEGDILYIGRNNIRDAYKLLTGELIDAQASGDYISYGWSREELGSFLIKRIDK